MGLKGLQPGVHFNVRRKKVEMSSYNILQTVLTCPRCGEEVESEIECHFGNTAQMLTLTIGSTYPWVKGRQPQNGGRPEGEEVSGEGYMECPACRRDSFLRVIVGGDTIVKVEPDRSRKGYTPD